MTEYAVTFRVCADPRCGCHNLSVHCAALLSDSTEFGPVRRFWVDARLKKVVTTPELQADPEALRLSEVVSTGLSKAAWDELERWFWTAKIESIEGADASEIDISHLPNADDGLTIPFTDVFPLGTSLHFEFDGSSWAADEQFCVRPGCRCANAVLSFLRLKDAAGRQYTSFRNVPVIRYDYRTRDSEELERGQTGAPDPAQLLQALKDAYPSLDQKLERHHRLVQSLYARDSSTQRNTPPSSLESNGPATSTKIQRNAPCHCGSGKKHKKCCGR